MFTPSPGATRKAVGLGQRVALCSLCQCVCRVVGQPPEVKISKNEEKESWCVSRDRWIGRALIKYRGVKQIITVVFSRRCTKNKIATSTEIPSSVERMALFCISSLRKLLPFHLFWPPACGGCGPLKPNLGSFFDDVLPGCGTDLAVLCSGVMGKTSANK